MKKILLFLLAMGTVVGLTACKTSEDKLKDEFVENGWVCDDYVCTYNDIGIFVYKFNLESYELEINGEINSNLGNVIWDGEIDMITEEGSIVETIIKDDGITLYESSYHFVEETKTCTINGTKKYDTDTCSIDDLKRAYDVISTIIENAGVNIKSPN